MNPFSLKAPPRNPGFDPGNELPPDDDGNDLPEYVDPLPHISSLNNLPTEAELLNVYKRTRFMLDNSHSLPSNIKVQVAKACQLVLANITKTQEQLYNQQRVKLMEDCLISTLHAFPDLKAHFLAAYEEALTTLENQE